MREKQIKSGSRNKKLCLIENQNPEGLDLYENICAWTLDCFAIARSDDYRRIFLLRILANKKNKKISISKRIKKACLDFFGNQEKYLGQILSIMGDGLESLSIG